MERCVNCGVIFDETGSPRSKPLCLFCRTRSFNAMGSTKMPRHSPLPKIESSFDWGKISMEERKSLFEWDDE